MSKRKLKPLKLTVHQIRRLMGLKIGEGFFVWKVEDYEPDGEGETGSFEVVEFSIEDETGKLLNDEGKELIWYGFENDKKKCYALVVSDVKEI